MLRAIGVKQKDTARIVTCADQTVVDAEEWLRQEDYSEVAGLCNDRDIQQTVAVEGMYWGLETEQVLKLTQLRADDILRHYRETDYMKAVEEAKTKANLEEERIRANIMQIRHEAGLPLSGYINKDGGYEI